VTPRVAKRGASFKGAAAYYLHDKNADTSRRVAFCVTRNLPTEEPELAWRWMAYTDRHAGILKHDAGAAGTGPKKRKPVYTLSLSWHADDKPEPDLMVRMMDSALTKVGLSRCQALYVAHNDTDHPHIHALVSLVDPHNGKIIDPGRDRDKLSRWAQAYERERGVIRCHRRVENNARRDRGEWVVDRHSKTRQDIEQAKLIEKRLLAKQKRMRPTRQAADRQALQQRARQEAEAIRTQIKEKFRPEWAQLYQRMQQDARDLGNAEKKALSRMRTLARNRSLMKVEGRDWIAAIMQGLNKARAAAAEQQAAQESALRRLRRRMADERAAAVAAVWADHRRDRQVLAKLHAEARKNPAARASENREKPSRPGPRGTGHYEALKPATAPAPVPGKDEVRGTRPGLRRDRRYDALKQATPATPTREEEDRRREELKAEFRKQAEEIARRRKERSRKQKDRDRDRER
jgi:hypothetical protein